MKLIPYLVNIKEGYSKSTNILPKELRLELDSKGHFLKDICKVEYLQQELFKEGTHLGDNLWTIYTHYSVGGKFYQLAFKIDTEKNESVNDFVLRLKTYSENGDEIYHMKIYLLKAVNIY